MKACSKCGESKALDYFHANAKYKDGRASCCKACANKAGSARYQANRERRSAMAKAYWETHKDKRLDRIRAYQTHIRASDKDAYRKKSLAAHHRGREQLTDWYCAAMIRQQAGGWPPGVEVPVDLIALKRESILLKRLGRQIKEAINQPQEEP